MRKEIYGPQRPVINDQLLREVFVKDDKPAIFDIRPGNSGRVSRIADDIRTFDALGAGAVRKYDDKIRTYSRVHNIDPDLVRSVMFAENARGHKLGLNAVADVIGRSDSVMPMNIQKNRWSGFLDKKPEDMYDPDTNIESSVILLRRIANRIDTPTPAKVGTLWNSLKATETNEFGEYIGEVYRKKPWQKID